MDDFADIAECKLHINQEMNYWIGKNSNNKKLKCEMEKAFQTTQLSNDDLSFFDKNEERRCNWLWCFLKENTMRFGRSDDGLYPFVGGDTYLSPKSYIDETPKIRLSNRPFEIRPSNIGARLMAIKESFKNGEVDLEGQREIIELLKYLWGKIYQGGESKSKQDISKWLDSSNIEQCDWAWDYIQNSEHKGLFFSWEPLGNKEKAQAIIAGFDIGTLYNLDRAELFFSKMKSAWSQKKFRDKSGGKKAYSINMTIKTKERLDELAEHYDCKLNEVIEKLIKKEHEIIKRGIKSS